MDISFFLGNLLSFVNGLAVNVGSSDLFGSLGSLSLG